MVGETASPPVQQLLRGSMHFVGFHELHVIVQVGSVMGSPGKLLEDSFCQPYMENDST